MSYTLNAINKYASTRPEAPALQTAELSVSYAELAILIEKLATRLKEYSPSVIGLLADNGFDWVLADLAALQAEILIVPLPTYFSSTQLQNTIESAGIDLILTDRTIDIPVRTDTLPKQYCNFHGSLDAVKITSGNSKKNDLPIGTQKITFTSGTTDTPKGVCLSIESMERVAHSLLGVTSAHSDDRHLCVLPLATLLENIAGVYLPLMAGATCLLPPLAQVGLTGSSGLNVAVQLAALDSLRATSAIIVPQMLTAQVAAISAGSPRPRALRYLAVGGGSVSPNLLAKANGLGLPVYEGYGLSECASVVALNSPGDNRHGSVGKPLPHVRIEIAPDGEIIVWEAHFEGYLGSASRHSSAALNTGDIGHLDRDGYLYVTGRKKSMFITSFGRNVSPEWIERELLAQPGLMQIAVFGDARPFNAAVIVPHPSMALSAISSAVAAANSTLPDYARVTHWIIAKTPFTADNNQLTHNGRSRRAEIGIAYLKELESLYRKESNPMTFYDQLCEATTAEQTSLQTAPIIAAALTGQASHSQYIAFLTQAYHHVRHTVPLLMACGARLPGDMEWLRTAVAHYINEELGHQEWILNDISAAGGNAEAVRKSRPALATELMVAYAYDTVMRNNPVGFFGMVFVLEGTSVQLATQVAKSLQDCLDLPPAAFSYLASHGVLDADHMDNFSQLMNRLESASDQEAIVHCAKVFFQLYGDVIRSVPTGAVA